MGRSLKGKELGIGISQRKDGIYQARFTDRFGRRKTIYAKKLNELRQKLREDQYADDKRLNVISEDITLDEWFIVWRDTYKRHCRDTTIACYTMKYNRIKPELGWRKLSSLNLIVLQDCINNLSNDQKRIDCKKILVDMLDKAVDSELLVKNVAKKINAVITMEPKKERRVLTIAETKTFLEAAEGTVYYDMYILALETGMRVGELCGLQWDDIDFKGNRLEVYRTLCYVEKDGRYGFQFHMPKSLNGRRTIPLTSKAIQALKRQRMNRRKIILSSETPPLEGFEGLVFMTVKAKPVELRTVQGSIKCILTKIRKKQAFEHFTPHTFRHTFATRAIERGMSPKTLQKILGHSTLRMTMDLYCHVTDDTLFDEMKRFEMYG